MCERPVYEYLCKMIGWQFVLCVLGVLTVQVLADTPANCTYSDVVGKWIFYEGTRNFDSSISCNDTGFVKRKIRVDLKFPNYAVDEYGNLGQWTMVYNQGFEVSINGRTFFAFSYFTQQDDNITSFCDRTLPSWSHDVTLRHWACFFGRKTTPVPPKYHADPFSSLTKLDETIPLEEHEAVVERINSIQTSWTATVYPRFVNMTHEELLRISGGRKSWLATRPLPKPATDFLKDSVSRLPSSFDWRDVDGVNFVSAVRDQGNCGSCYAFSSMGQLESRIRVRTNNTLKLQLSPQDVVSCSKLAQGCEGGFPYLVAGKYGQEYGTVEERCNPYEGEDGPCTGRNCLKHYTAHYGYVGGYYGACNEQQMIMELIHGGPISVSFEVYPDFRNYKGGVYRHLNELEYDPFVLVNHAVLLVGYGVDGTTGDKYWIVKNSWGEDWGENGYFRILRGTNECGIESTAVHATPIP